MYLKLLQHINFFFFVKSRFHNWTGCLILVAPYPSRTLYHTAPLVCSESHNTFAQGFHTHFLYVLFCFSVSCRKFIYVRVLNVMNTIPDSIPTGWVYTGQKDLKH